MKRAAWLIALFAIALYAQESHEAPKTQEPAKAGEHAPAGHEPAKHEAAGEGAHEGGGHEEGPGIIWKWANFAILAGGLGYLIGKNAGPFFAARTQQIRKDMVDSQEARRQAEARAAEVDRRLAALEGDIAGLRAESQREAQAETERLARHTTGELAKIQAHAEQEIASAGKAARTELKRYSAELAIQLAEQRLRNRMTPETQQALVRGFVRDLDQPASPAND
jgi:F-type H+-transporting ATPase subunit b